MRSAVGWKRGVSAENRPSVEEAMVLPVLVHDGEAAGAPVARAGFADIDHAGVEVPLLAQQALIDHVRDEVRDPPPVRVGRREGGALQLLLGQHVPQPELDAQAVALGFDAAGDQRLRTDHAPVLEARRLGRALGGLDEGLAVHRAEQAGIAQVRLDDAGDVAPDARGIAGPGQVGDGNRDRVGARPGDVDDRARGSLGRSRQRGGEDAGRDQAGARTQQHHAARGREGGGRVHRTRPLGLKRKTDAITVWYLFGGIRSGLHCGDISARRADS